MARTHGMTFGTDGKRTALNRLWLAIRNKCHNPDTPDFKYYGGRGIMVSDDWESFEKFVEDVGPHPGNGLTLDRIDVNGHYEKSNVRWATRQTQAQNRNYCKIDEAMAAEIRRMYGPYTRYARWSRPGLPTQAQIAEKFGVTQAHVSHILRGAAWE